MAGLTVRRVGNRVEVLSADGRVLCTISGEHLRLEYQPVQADVEDLDVRDIRDPQLRVVADKVNELLGALRLARVLREAGGE